MEEAVSDSLGFLLWVFTEFPLGWRLVFACAMLAAAWMVYYHFGGFGADVRAKQNLGNLSKLKFIWA